MKWAGAEQVPILGSLFSAAIVVPLELLGMNPAPTQRLYASTIDALYTYMADCQFGKSHLNATCFSMALEYVYQPRLRFWRDFDISYLFTAVTRWIPNWRPVLEHVSNGAADSLLWDVKEFLRVKAFDEANAELIMALPAHERPSGSAAAFAWVSSELLQRGLTTELEFARRDGEACGEQALEAVRCFEGAAAGRMVNSTAALVARAYRDAVMKRQTESATC